MTTSGVGQITSYSLRLHVKAFEEKPPFDIFNTTTVDQVLTGMVTTFEAIPSHFLFYGISSGIFQLEDISIAADILFYIYHMGNISDHILLLLQNFHFR